MKSFIKKHLYLLVLPLLAFFISCTEDDGTGDIGTREDLIGTWNVTGVDIDVLVDGVDFLQWITENLGASAAEAQLFQTLFEEEFTSDFDGTITFNEDGTYTTNIGEPDNTETGMWTFSGTTLTLTPDIVGDDPTTLTALSLNSSNSSFEFTESEMEDLDEDGTEETLSITIQLTLAK